MALSLGGLRRKIEIAMLPDDVRVVLQLDGLAERERHRRRGRALSRIAQLDQRTALAANICTRRKRTCGPQGGSPGFTTDIGQLAATMPLSALSISGRWRPRTWTASDGFRIVLLWAARQRARVVCVRLTPRRLGARLGRFL